jgi:sterol 14-demethylase
MASCAELADDFKAIEEIQDLYWQLEKSATPMALLLPWFPGPAKKTKERVTKDLYLKLCDYVELRKNAAVPSSDAIDVLLAKGVPQPEIVQVSEFRGHQGYTQFTMLIVHARCHFCGSN